MASKRDRIVETGADISTQTLNQRQMGGGGATDGMFNDEQHQYGTTQKGQTGGSASFVRRPVIL
jgi:hypothetical protein